ncbi:MAG: hypothetical protein KDE19_14960, partial [Caldilineaceae bacterium]|nr:hypothetical protein [Caldilineaceae bacterium]
MRKLLSSLHQQLSVPCPPPTRQALLVLCILLLSLAGCNNDAPTPTPPPNPEAMLATTSEPAESAVGSTAISEPGQTQGSNAPTAQTATPTPEPVGTLTLWHSWAEADGDALATILAAFGERYPELQINTLFVA